MAGVDWVLFRAPRSRRAVRDAGGEGRGCLSGGRRTSSVHGDADVAARLAPDGLHLGQQDLFGLARTRGAATSRHLLPLEQEIRRALELEPDYLLLGPCGRREPPGRAGHWVWDGSETVAASPVPVYGIGGSGPGASRRSPHPWRHASPPSAACGIWINSRKGFDPVTASSQGWRASRKPVAEIDEPAAVAAERLPLRILRPRHRFAAVRTGDCLDVFTVIADNRPV